MGDPFWEQDVQVVADKLVGATLVVGEVEVTILVTEPFRRKTNATGIYKPMLDMAPGQFFGPKSRNSILPLITALDHGQHGGCVIIRTIEVNGEIYDGPGRTSERLGITESRTIGSVVREDRVFTIGLGVVPHPVVRPGKRPSVPRNGNGIGEKTIEALMPQIANAFIRRDPRVSFKDFLNGLLETSKSEAEFRRALQG